MGGLLFIVYYNQGASPPAEEQALGSVYQKLLILEMFLGQFYVE